MFGKPLTSRPVKMQNRELTFRVIACNMHGLTVFVVWFLQSPRGGRFSMSSGEVPQPENIKGMFCLFLSGHHMEGREIKGDKTVFEDLGKYNLPKGWIKATIDNVSLIIQGQSPPSSTYNQEKIGLPFFQGKADFGSLYPVTRNWCSIPKKTCRKK